MIKKGDFIELDYTARLKDDKVVFDTTSEEVAKNSEIYNKEYSYVPVIICVGERHLIPGLDNAMIGKNEGKYTIMIQAEDGFGKKRADLLKLLPLKLFKKDEIQPFPGLDVNVDGQMGIVRSVSGGRVIVDFNHPLASKDLVYDVEIKRIVTDPIEMVKAMLEIMHFPFKSIEVAEKKGVVQLMSKLPDDITNEVGEEIKRLVGLEAIEFVIVQKQESKDSKHDHSHANGGHNHGANHHEDDDDNPAEVASVDDLSAAEPKYVKKA